MTHEEIREQLEAYALGALEPADRRAVGAHLATCEECRRAAEEYALAVEALPAALAAASRRRPAPATRARLLRSVAQGPPWRRLLAAGGAVAAVLLVAVLAWALQLSQSLAQERALYQRLAEHQAIVFEVVDSPRTTKLLLRSPVTGSAAYGKVFTRPDLPYVVAMAANLPGAPAGSAYHLWVTLDSGETALVGLLETNREGFGALVWEADRNGPTFQSARLTLQPKGASTPEGVPALLWVR